MEYKINYVDTGLGKVWTLRCGTKRKTPLLIIHGGPGFPHNYLENLKELAAEREVVFYDQLGCGFSERPLDDKYRDLAYFIDEVNEVRTKLELNEVVLLGHSMGAALACEHAVISPNGIRGIIFASPFLNTEIWMKGARKNLESMPLLLQQSIRKHEREKTTYSDEYALLKEEYDKRFGLRIRPIPKQVEESNQGFDFETYLKLWGNSEFHCSGTLKNYEAPVKRLPHVPILFTCGQFDSAQAEYLEEIQREVPNSELIEIENSSHMPHIEQKDAYLKLIGHFLIGHSL